MEKFNYDIHKQHIIETASKFNTIGMFRMSHEPLYRFAKDNNFIHELQLAPSKSKYNLENILAVSRLCATKTEFNQRFHNYHEAARRLDFLEKACEHMIPMQLNFAQKVCKQIGDYIFDLNGSYSDRTIIPPYELDVFYPTINIAIEFQGTRWHKSESVVEKDIIKTNMCKQKNILLIHIYEYGKFQLHQIREIKDQFIKYLPIINEFLGRNIQAEDISNFEVDTQSIYHSVSIKHIEDTVKKYQRLEVFKKENPGMYHCLSTTNRMDIVDSIRERKVPIKWKNMTNEDIIRHVLTYNFSNFSEFSKNETLRTICRRRNIINQIKQIYDTSGKK